MKKMRMGIRRHPVITGAVLVVVMMAAVAGVVVHYMSHWLILPLI